MRRDVIHTALEVVAEALAAENVNSEIVQVGRNCVKGCIGCGACSESLRCVFDGGIVNEILDKMEDSDCADRGDSCLFCFTDRISLSLFWIESSWRAIGLL